MMTLSLLVAIIPPIVLLFVMYKLDKKEKEPIPLLLQFFALGVLAIIPAAIFETNLCDSIELAFGENVFSIIVESFFGIALVEESCKWLALRIRSHKLAEYNCRFDGVVYVTFVTLGFATFENILYVIEDGMATAIMRALTAIPGHLYFSVYMGYFLSKSIESKLKSNTGSAVAYSVLSIVVPTIFHGIYDSLLIINNVFTIILWIGFVLAFFVLTIVFIILFSKSDEYFVDPRVWVCPKCRLTMFDKFCGQCGTAKVK